MSLENSAVTFNELCCCILNLLLWCSGQYCGLSLDVSVSSRLSLISTIVKATWKDQLLKRQCASVII